MGAIQRPTETVPLSWTPEVDGGSGVLQRHDSMRSMIDAAVGGTLMSKTKEEA